MKPNIESSEQDRQAALAILSALLADEYVLCTTTRGSYWNAVGPQFNERHTFFEPQYSDLNDTDPHGRSR